MDLIAKARAKHMWLLAEAAKIEAFIAMAEELGAETVQLAPVAAEAAIVQPARAHSNAAPVAAVNRAPPSRPKTGIGADTLNAAELIIREEGPLSSRDLLPHVLAMGIGVGGKDPVATLSARISNKGDLVTYNGKWHFKDQLATLGPSGLRQEEAADIPTKDTAASLFINQEGGERDAPALT